MAIEKEVFLSLQSLYPTPPRHLVQEFVAFVRATGQPEKFPTISTTKPPREGVFEILEWPVDVNRKLRPNNDEAPCSICSSDKGKWLRRGALIWCEATSAIYVIGPTCYDTQWERGRFQSELNRHRQSVLFKQNKAKLQQIVSSFGGVVAWIAQVRGPVERVNGLHGSCARELKRTRRSLVNAFRGGDANLPRIDGIEFLRGAWSLSSKMVKAHDTLVEIQEQAGADPEAWVETLSDTVVARNVQAAQKAYKQLKEVYECCEQARLFLSADNIRRIAAWSASDRLPIELRAHSTVTAVDFRTSNERWRAPINLSRVIPPPSPGL